MVHIITARHLSAITMRMLLLLTGCGNYTAHPGPHSEIKGERQRQEERHGERGSAFTGSRVSWAHSLPVT